MNAKGDLVMALHSSPFFSLRQRASVEDAAQVSLSVTGCQRVLSSLKAYFVHIKAQTQTMGNRKPQLQIFVLLTFTW